jgi:hypothetical protein
MENRIPSTDFMLVSLPESVRPEVVAVCINMLKPRLIAIRVPLGEGSDDIFIM